MLAHPMKQHYYMQVHILRSHCYIFIGHCRIPAILLDWLLITPHVHTVHTGWLTGVLLLLHCCTLLEPR